MQELARLTLGARDVGEGNLSRDDTALNLPGWGAPRHGDPVLKGIGLLEQRNGGYALSSLGRRLGERYRENCREIGWKTDLARILLTREPRTRTVARLLTVEGATLEFPRPEWFAGPYKDVILRSNDRTWHPFADPKDEQPEIQTLLDEAGKWALGDWATDPEVREGEAIRFAGINASRVSANKLGSSLRGPFELFLNLGLVSVADGIVSWQRQKAYELLPPELLCDLGMDAGTPRSVAEKTIQFIEALAADDGFVVASELRAALQREGVASPDREIARLIDDGIIRLEAFDYGQSRHGQGLFDDPRKQLVKFRVTSTRRIATAS
jgi:hypothetical protein